MPELVDLRTCGLELSFDMRYAKDTNFTGAPVYQRDRAALVPEALDKLAKAHALAKRLGYGMLIYDAYRPPEAQWALWRHTPDPDFLADPRRGSPHSRGIAVDLTLTVDGVAIDMGTDFDAFTPLSHHAADGLSETVLRNRMMLMAMMMDAEYDFYRHEWWHYQLFRARELYPIIRDGEALAPMMA